MIGSQGYSCIEVYVMNDVRGTGGVGGLLREQKEYNLVYTISSKL
jgi:hypothetical protein